MTDIPGMELLSPEQQKDLLWYVGDHADDLAPMHDICHQYHAALRDLAAARLGKQEAEALVFRLQDDVMQLGGAKTDALKRVQELEEALADMREKRIHIGDLCNHAQNRWQEKQEQLNALTAILQPAPGETLVEAARRLRGET